MRLTQNNRKKNRLDITPLIDVVFLLLIFFMLTFSLPDHGISLNLPSQQAGMEPQVSLTLEVHQDGSLTLNNQSINHEYLVTELQRKLADRNDKALTVDVHSKVEYDIFIRVLDLAKKAGAESFSIIH